MILTNCPVSAKISTYFEATNANINSDGRLINKASSGAGNVDIELLSGVDPINLKATTYAGQSTTPLSFTSVVGTTSHTFNLKARYHATGQASAGPVESSVTYNIIYE